MLLSHIKNTSREGVGGVGVWRVMVGAGRGPGHSGRWGSKSIQKESKEGIEAP
jgi:hypothetical protein